MNPCPAPQSAGRHRRAAITLIEVLFILAILVIVVAAVYPNLRLRKQRPSVTRCLSHLKQVGLAYIIWAHENEASSLPMRVPAAQGGLLGHPAASDITVQFAHLSNALASPNVFSCPGDRQIRIAESFGADPKSGLLQPRFRTNAISYALNMDFGLDTNGRPLSLESSAPQIVVADRNLMAGDVAPCAFEIPNTLGVVTGNQALGFAAKPDYGHGALGNVALGDGSVQKATRPDLAGLLQSADQPGLVHFLYPRAPETIR